MRVYTISLGRDDRKENSSIFTFQTLNSIKLGITNQIAVQGIVGIPLNVPRLYAWCSLCENTLPDRGLYSQVVCDVFPNKRVNIMNEPRNFLYYPIDDGQFHGSINRFDVKIYNENYMDITPQIGGIILRIEIDI